MLEIASEGILRTIIYLNRYYPRKETVTVHIMEEYDTIEGPDGQKGFGVYVPETKEIFLAGDIPEKEDNIIKTLAHEYRHFLQHCCGEPFNEQQAETFAEEIYKMTKGIGL